MLIFYYVIQRTNLQTIDPCVSRTHYCLDYILSTKTELLNIKSIPLFLARKASISFVSHHWSRESFYCRQEMSAFTDFQDELHSYSAFIKGFSSSK